MFDKLIRRWRKRHLQWFWIASVNALSRILETVAMLLPVKAAFLLIRPDALEKLLVDFTLTIEAFVILLMLVVSFSVISSKFLQAYSRQKAKLMHQHLENLDAETLSMVTIRVASAMIVMLVYSLVLVFVDWQAFLFMMLLVLLMSLPWSGRLNKAHKVKFYRFFGIQRRGARYRFAGQVLVLVFVTVILLQAVRQDEPISIMLVVVILLARRFFQTFAGFSNGLHERKLLKTGRKLEYDD